MKTAPPSSRRTAGALAVAAVLTLALSGCAFAAGLADGVTAAKSTPRDSSSAAQPRTSNLTRDAAAALIDAVPGLGNASVGSVISGLSTKAIIEVYGTAAAINAPGVLDYVLAVGWATNVNGTPAILSLTVRDHGTLLDLQDCVNALVGKDYPSYPLIDSAYLDGPVRWGPWPGAVPAPLGSSPTTAP